MRRAFMNALLDEDLYFLTADLGYSVVEAFQEKHPERFINVGVAEQNMIGVAAGLALAGHTAVTYSIGNFAVLRCLEQIRNDVCYHNLNVKIVAVGAGKAYGSLGYTHHLLEDLAVMLTLPHLTVFSPADPGEAVWATKEMLKIAGPCYLRLGKSDEEELYDKRDLQVGDPVVVREGKGRALVGTGPALKRLLDMEGCVISLPTLKPLNEEKLWALISDCDEIVSAEDHGENGLSSLLRALIVKKRSNVKYEALILHPDL